MNSNVNEEDSFYFPEIKFIQTPQINITKLVQNDQGRNNVVMIKINNKMTMAI